MSHQKQPTFADLELDDALCTATADCGFDRPTSIQQAVIPLALEQTDLLASAPTGTGKTAAFILPAAQFLLDFPRQSKSLATRVLILVPTRELAIQIYEQTTRLIAHTQITAAVITGGINYGSDHKSLSKTLDILIATPGRLLEHIEQERADCRDIEVLVLDEADRMLDMGFATIVSQIASEARWRKQTMLFSATIDEQSVQRLSKDILDNPVEVRVDGSRKEKGKILEWYYLADDLQHKLKLVTHIVSHQTTTAIVFVKTRERVQWLKDKLASSGIAATWLQGEMPQDKRNSALASFKSGTTKVLVATDVAARGIDVHNVSHVINFDLPRSADVYVHRIGRTGRAGAKGSAISLVEAHDFAMLGRIMRYVKRTVKARVIKELRPQNKAPSLRKKKKTKARKKK